MSNVPEQVRRSAERARELEQQMLNPTPPADLPQPAPGAPEAPPNDPPPAPPPQVEPPAPAVPQPDVARLVEANERLAQQYRSLQGMFAATERNSRELLEQLKAERARVTALEAAAQTAPQTAKPQVTEADLQAYGAEMLDMVRRAAAEVASRIVDERLGGVEQLVAPLEQRVDQVVQTTNQTAEEIFFGRLSEARPDWRAVNENDQFLSWLQENDLMTGITRQLLLNDAVAKGDVVRTKAIFDAFSPPAPPPVSAPAQIPAPPPVSPQPRAVGNVPPPPAAPQAKLWTRPEIEAFYADVRRGVYRTDPQRKAQIEADLAAAMQEGRIR